MNQSRVPSPAHSLGAPVPPKRHTPRRSRSVGSPARSMTSGRLPTAVDQFKEYHRISFRLSPLSKTILNDNTDIEEPRRTSWWKKIDNSRDISTTVDVLEEGRNREKAMETNILHDEFDIEVLSQEKKDYTIDMPESSGSESIGSIIIPQRKLLYSDENDKQPIKSKPKDNLHQLRESLNLPESSGSESIGSIIIPQRKLLNYNDNQPKNLKPKDTLHQFTSKRESPGKSNNTDIYDKAVNVGAKKLFNEEPKRTTLFPAALLMISPDKTVVNKTKELVAEAKGQARNLFGKRPATKRKNMFADFIVSESEDEISEIQTKFFAFNKVPEPVNRRGSTRGLRDLSPSSSNTTDLNMDDWDLLPSSTMVDHQLEAMVAATTPGKRARLSNRLSKVSEAKDSEAGTKSTITDSKTKQFNISTSSKEKPNSSSNNVAKEQAGDVLPENEQMDTNALNQFTTSSKIKNTSQNNVNVEIITKDDGGMVDLDNQEHIENEILNPQHPKSNDIANDQKNIANEEKTQQVNDQTQRETINNVTSKAAEDQAQDDDDDFVLTYDENKQLEETEQENLKKSKENNIEEKNKSKEGDKIHEHLEKNKITLHYIEETPFKEKSQHVINKVIEETDEDIDNAQVVEEKMDDDKHGETLKVKEKLEQNVETPKGINDKSKLNELEEVMRDIVRVDQEKANVEMETNQQEEKSQIMEIDEEHDIHEECDSEIESWNEEENQDEINESQEVHQSMENEEIEEYDEEQDEEEEIQYENDNESEKGEEIEENQDEINESQELEDEEENQEIEDQETPNESEDNDEEEEETEEHRESEEILNEEDEEHNVSEIEDQIEEVAEPLQISEPEKETPNESLDTTGRNRQEGIESPEVILNDVTNQFESFIAKGRNTSVRKTSILKNFSIRPSMDPPTDSIRLSDGTKNSSAEGSGWDSHRTTRKTLRQTFGRDFTPRKSLRALVMEKSAKRQTAINEANAKLNLPQANSTELPGNAPQEEINDEENVEVIEESDCEMSLRTRQTTLEMYVQKIKKETIEHNRKLDEYVRNSLKHQPTRPDYLNNLIAQPTIRRMATKPQKTAPKPMKTKRTGIPLECLPQELIEDLKYKPPKRFKGRNASWISKRLYKFLESKLEPKYDYKARVRSEKLVAMLYNFTREIRKARVAPAHDVARVQHEMARLQIVRTYFEFYEFIREYFPLEIKIKIVPDIINDIPLPRNGVFADILTGEVV